MLMGGGRRVSLFLKEYRETHPSFSEGKMERGVDSAPLFAHPLSALLLASRHVGAGYSPSNNGDWPSPYPANMIALITAPHPSFAAEVPAVRSGTC